MILELNCCWIAVILAITNLISLFVFFNYSIKINGKDKAIQINKNSLPINWEKLQTNYPWNNKIKELETMVKELQEKLNKQQGKKQKNIIPSDNSYSDQQKENIPLPPPLPKKEINRENTTQQDLKTALHEELKKRRKKIDGEE
jgi:hypothetical protein